MSTAGGARISVDGISVKYPRTTEFALQGITLEIKPGELVVVLGPSGCGKSTLIRTMNRLVTPDAGKVFIDGKDIAGVDIIALRRTIGYVIQSAGLFAHLSVGANVGFVPALLRWEKARIAGRVDELLTLVRLDPGSYRERSIKSLSGGEAQRVGVARALAAGPALLLMDEPFGALDPVVRTDLQHELRNIINTAGTTTVLVTHDVEEAMRLADRIVVMHHGRILQQATPLEILRAPANEHVAQLLGSETLTRRLSLIPVSAAVVHHTQDSALPVLNLPSDATLDLALNAFLGQPETTAFRVGDVGTLSFADLARAIAAPPA